MEEHGEYRTLVRAAALAALLAGALASVTLASVMLAARPAAGCDLALALAVDVSGSVDAREYRVQMDGLAAALAADPVAEALIAGRAEVTVIQWSGERRQAVTVPWTRMADHAALDGFVARVAAAPRRWSRYSTGIGSALVFVGAEMAAAGACRRQVIDVSGDGRSNEGPAPQVVAAALAARGITVNGLAITGSEPDLVGYFHESVIAGPGAFVMSARSHYEYPAAIRRKLIAEVVRPVAGLAAGGP